MESILTVGEMTKEGDYPVTFTEDAAYHLNNLKAWSVKGDYWIWKFAAQDKPQLDWRILKIPAFKDDRWRSKSKSTAQGTKTVIESEVLSTTETLTIAGNTFKNCIKVRHLWRTNSGIRQRITIYFAKSVGLLKATVRYLSDDADDDEMEQKNEEVDEQVWLQLEKYSVTPYIPTPDRLFERATAAAEIVLIGNITSVKSAGRERTSLVEARVNPTRVFRGEVNAKEIIIDHLPRDSTLAPPEKGEFILLLSEGGFREGKNRYRRVFQPVAVTDQKVALVKKIILRAEKPTIENLIAESSAIVCGEMEILEERGDFKYYVVKVTKTYKAEKELKYVDLLIIEKMPKLEENIQYIFFLSPTEKADRPFFTIVCEKEGIKEFTKKIEEEIEKAKTGK